MRRAIVTDAGVLTLHFIGDPRVEEYFDKLDEGKIQGYISNVNLA